MQGGMQCRGSKWFILSNHPTWRLIYTRVVKLLMILRCSYPVGDMDNRRACTWLSDSRSYANPTVICSWDLHHNKELLLCSIPHYLQLRCAAPLSNDISHWSNLVITGFQYTSPFTETPVSNGNNYLRHDLNHVVKSGLRKHY